MRRPGKITDASPIFQSKDEQAPKESESSPRQASDRTNGADEPKAEPVEADALADAEEVKENHDG